MDKQILEQEKEHLEKTKEKLTHASNVLNEALDALGASNIAMLKELKDNPETDGADFQMFVQQLHEKNSAFNIKDKVKRIEELGYLLKEPYFARIDLAQVNDEVVDKLYIGKFGYTEKRPVVVDWRAKIASVYYRYRYPQKNVEYNTPEGKVTTDLLLKRTFEIDEGEFIKYYNNDLQLDEDQIIADKIKQRTGGVLEDIVETIQESQLDIIESDPRKVCIVQGSVGSGKSTVAIHKLSHIFFNYQDLIKPERAILVAKSGVLVKYLATLFPKLGIFDINYKTLRELIYNVLFREEIPYKFDLDKNTNLSEFDLKKLNDLKGDIKEIHTEYENKIAKLLQDEINASLASFVYDRKKPVAKNIDELIQDLNEELLFQKEKYKDNTKSVRAWIFKDNMTNLRKFISKLQTIKRDLKSKTFNSACKKLGINLKEPFGYKESLLYVYLHSELFGFEKTQRYQYCVVDEGQDFNVLEYLVLGKFVQHGRFCILGDLNQSYVDGGLTSWDTIKAVVDDAHSAETFTLDTNYRSTQQIIEYANKILKPFTSNYLPKSINRMGPEIKILKCDSEDDILDKFQADIHADMEDLKTSIGIVCFNDNLYNAAMDIVEDNREQLNIEEHKIIRLHERKSITYIPQGVYITHFNDCKGLEFSKVYILGSKVDDINNFIDAKRTFVAVTRAMNEVHLYDLS